MADHNDGNDDDHNVWLAEAGKQLAAARRGSAGILESSLRQLCKRAFRDFRFAPPSFWMTSW